jgi:hypothetical protein
VCLEREVRDGVGEGPYLDSPVQARTGEGGGILRVDGKVHDVVCVPLEGHDAFPALVPVPGFDHHVVAAREHDGGTGMDGETADVVRMRLESGDLVVCVVVEDAQLKVVRTGHEPVFARDKPNAAHGHLGDLEGLDERTRGGVVDVDRTVVQAGEQPWLGRVEVDRFDSVGAGEERSLAVYCEQL